MGRFPFFIEVENKEFLIIGGGKVAARKVSRLLSFTGRITVAAPDTEQVEAAIERVRRRADLSPDDRMASKNAESVMVRREAYDMGMLDGADFCIAATDDAALNEAIAQECGIRKIPVNVANAPHRSTWEFPALVKRGDLTVAISTSGSSPAYAKELRAQIEGMIPPHICDILERMTALRDMLPTKVKEQKDRENIYRKVLAALTLADNEISDEQLAAMITEEIQGLTEK